MTKFLLLYTIYSCFISKHFIFYSLLFILIIIIVLSVLLHSLVIVHVKSFRLFCDITSVVQPEWKILKIYLAVTLCKKSADSRVFFFLLPQVTGKESPSTRTIPLGGPYTAAALAYHPYL